MLIIGLLIAAAAAVFSVVEIVQNSGGTTSTIHGFGQILGHFTSAEIFLAGIATTVIFFLGYWVLSVSSRIRRRASQKRRAENRATREERDAVIAERDWLAKALETERSARISNLLRNREAQEQQSANVQPAAQQPGVVQPAAQPGVTQPGATQPVTARPMTAQPIAYPSDAEVYGDRAGSQQAGSHGANANLNADPNADSTDDDEVPIRRRHGLFR